MQRSATPTYVVMSLLWGAVYLLIREVLAGFGWAWTVALGSLLVGMTIAVIGWRHLQWPLRWRRVLLLGAAVALQLVGLALAVQGLGIALAAVVVGTVPLFACLIGQMTGRERITGPGAAGLVLGFVGLLLVLLFPAGEISWAFLAGVLAGLLSALAGAWATTYAHASFPRADRAGLVATAFLAAGLLVLPFAPFFPGQHSPALPDLLRLLLLGVVFGGIGYVLEFRLRDQTGPERVASARSVATVLAVLIGILVLRESLSAGQLVGTLFVLAGCSLVLRMVPRWLPEAWRR